MLSVRWSKKYIELSISYVRKKKMKKIEIPMLGQNTLVARLEQSKGLDTRVF